MSEVVLVRHGETVGQSSIRLYGSTDLALAAEGEAQIRASSAALAGSTFARVLCSPMSRALRSAEVLLEALDHPPIPIERVGAWTEIDFGRWEGWTWAEVRERDPEHHARWSSEGLAFRFPEGELRAEFADRVRRELPRLLEAVEAGPVLVVAHKGVIRVLANALAGEEAIPEHVELPLGGLHRLARVNGRFGLVGTQR